MSVVFKIALRELRGGLKGFWILLICMMLGVAGIAAIGSLQEAIQKGLSAESRVLLGGDANLRFTYRFADGFERNWIQQNSETFSEIVDFRSMVVSQKNQDTERALVQVKGVDNAYPIYGEVILDTGQGIHGALSGKDGYPGIVAARVLVDRLGLNNGDILRLGTQDYVLMGVIEVEPDAASSGFSFGPRVIVSLPSLKTSGLLQPGTLFNSHYRIKLQANAQIIPVKTDAVATLGDSGMRWTDARNGTPGINRFVVRLGAFLTLIGLAGLAVGGIGVSAAVSTFMEKKTHTIATLKTLGAKSKTIFSIYLLQIGIISAVGIIFGIIAGGVAIWLLGPIIGNSLPVPAKFSIYPMPLLEAAIYGVLIALIFTIWPLAHAVGTRAAGLFRDNVQTFKLPKLVYIICILILFATLIFFTSWFSGAPTQTIWATVSTVIALVILWFASIGVRMVARKMRPINKPSLRLALKAIAGPGNETAMVILSLGLGLSVLATIGQIDRNIQTSISEELPKDAPAYFFVDIQNDQLSKFNEISQNFDGVSRIDTAPMLRGIITKVNGEPAKGVFGNHWVLSGDRGLTYSVAPPSNSTITQGEWWDQEYDGPPVMSFSANEAEELGLKLGDELTVNVLGMDITAKIQNFREIDFANMGINFLMSFNPSALEGAPHTHIATVYANEQSEAPLLRALAETFPNITAIRVRDIINQVSDALQGIGSAVRWGAAATLLIGLVVLFGAAAAGEHKRSYEAAILKTVGAKRSTILLSFALRSAIMGAAAGSIAILVGSVTSWAVITFIMEVPYSFDFPSALITVAIGASLNLLAGIIFAIRPLKVRPAHILRLKTD